MARNIPVGAECKGRLFEIVEGWFFCVWLKHPDKPGGLAGGTIAESSSCLVLAWCWGK